MRSASDETPPGNISGTVRCPRLSLIVPIQFSQLPPIESFRLATGEVHLWTLDLAGGLDETRLWRLLDAEERGRASRFRHTVTKRRFVLTRGALRELLGRYLATEPAGLSFLLGSRGKPRLSGTEPERGLVFNISHSGDRALFALALDTCLGVDIEAWRELKDMEGMAIRCFSPPELVYWQRLRDEARLPAFFNFWTCKEAFVKAVGAGITLGLERCVIDVANDPRLLAVPEEYGHPQDWDLLGLAPGRGYSAAVCVKGSIHQVRTGDLADTFENP